MLFIIIFIWEREHKQEWGGRGGRGKSRLPVEDGAQCRTQSQDSGIMTWATQVGSIFCFYLAQEAPFGFLWLKAVEEKTNWVWLWADGGIAPGERSKVLYQKEAELPEPRPQQRVTIWSPTSAPWQKLPSPFSWNWVELVISQNHIRNKSGTS